MRHPLDRQFLAHAVSALLTVAVLLLFAVLLLRAPATDPEPATEDGRLEVRFTLRPGQAVVPRLPTVPADREVAQAPASRGALAPAASPVGPGPATTPAVPAARGPLLYDAEGRVLVPDGVVATTPVPGKGERALDPHNPVDYRGTRFEGDWISDGSVGDVAAQSIARGQKKVAEFLMGKDIQHAEARPPPQVAFNPARHERPSDLGSEATGDAWKAAPVSDEPAPGLDGSASRALRGQVAELERGHGRCPRERLEKLMEPVREALAQLQAVEHALAKGADPVRAKHQLPSTANTAWNQARRALWYARQKLQDCRG